MEFTQGNKTFFCITIILRTKKQKQNKKGEKKTDKEAIKEEFQPKILL